MTNLIPQCETYQVDTYCINCYYKGTKDIPRGNREATGLDLSNMWLRNSKVQMMTNPSSRISPKDMTEELKSQITTAAFCAYIMHVRGCSQPEALKIMAELCAITQVPRVAHASSTGSTGEAMSVYVDDMNEDFGRMKMCHMIADSSPELLEMATKIGVKAKWIQHPGTYREHFDICMSKRKQAVEHGAVQITWRDYAVMVRARQPKESR